MKCMSVFVTGDTHAGWLHRLNMESFPEQKQLSKDDYVIILGDFGFWQDTKEERYNLDWLDSRSFTTLWIDGNHENYDRIKELPVEEWHGGKIQRIRPSVIHLMRGQVFEIEGKKIFTFGGASSHDIRDGILEPDQKKMIKEWNKDPFKLFRINHVSWWKEELPSEEEMQEGLENLRKNGNRVDYVLTHSPYTSLLRQIDGGSGFYQSDILTDYLQQVKQTVDFKHWLFGHMHTNQTYQWERASCLYEQIIQIL